MTATQSRSIAAVDVTVDGAALPEELLRRLVSVRVCARLANPTQCELAFATWRDSAAELDRAPLGAAVTVRLAGDPGTLFDGEVTCIEVEHEPDGHAVTRIRAYDKLHRLRKRQQQRVFTDLTAQDLAGELTGDLGVDVGADDAGPSWERVVQYRQTDFELLTEVAGRCGLYPTLRGGELRLVSLAGDGETVDLELGTNLLQARIEANLDRVSRGCTAYGWDTRTAEVISEHAGTPRSGRQIPLDPNPEDVGVDGELTLVDQPGRSPDEIEAVAQAALDAAAGRAVTISGVAEGDARLRPGATIDVTGVAERVRGRYVLTEVVHTVDAAGYLTAFGTEPPQRPPAAPDGGPFNQITLGKVTAVDDPDNLGRVEVSLPAHADADVGWLGVVCPGAGRGKGLVALPDVDDTVLVAMPHGGPVGGLVLGSLYGAVEPPDPGVEGGKVKRWNLHTADGHSITIDDAEHRIRITDKTGSRLELAPGRVLLHAATDLTIQAPGKAITVRAKTIDFVHAPEPEEVES
ncbi:MAG TPA: contractile injection system protein, VgrG/Pvc8 family [Pseudonocardiaceae bacterium]|nr:contractile injection system protein, VgrG/Pvc8 family [Pseudonocardiaceae bacterium]